MKLFKLSALIFSMFVVVVLTGCAAPANYQNMIVKPTSEMKLNPKLKGNVVVASVKGGSNADSMWVSEVASAFKRALEASLKDFGYLSTSDTKGKYKIDADLISIKKESFFHGVQYRSNVKYTVSFENSVKTYNINVVGRASTSEKLVGIKPTMVCERSIEENIKEFLKKLSSF